MRQRVRLTATANEWALNGRDTSYLLRGSALAEVQGLTGLSPLAREFVDASQRREQWEARREVRRARGVAVGAVLLSIVAFTLGAIAVWLCYGAANLLAGPRVALIAATIHAINPFQIFQVGIVSSEGFTAFMLLLVVYATLRWQAAMEEQPAWRQGAHLLLVVAALGVGMLTRSAFGPIGAVTVLYIGLVAWRTTKRGSEALVWAGAVVVGCSLIVGPWLVRNHRLFGVWMLESKIGLNLNTGFHDLADGTADRDFVDTPPGKLALERKPKSVTLLRVNVCTGKSTSTTAKVAANGTFKFTMRGPDAGSPYVLYRVRAKLAGTGRTYTTQVAVTG